MTLANSRGVFAMDAISTLYNPLLRHLARRVAMEDISEPASALRYRWEIEEAGRCLRAGRTEGALVSHGLTLRVMQLLD